MNGSVISRRDFLRAGGAAVALLGSGTFAARAATDASRIALVIGNNAYPFAPLGNAINDANAVSAVLERAGCKVTLRTNTSRDELREAARIFGNAARSGEAKQVFFYYAGHGAQLNWRNYLVPVDANVGAITDLQSQCLELGVLIEEFSRVKDKVFVIILDACRDHPFGTTFQTAQRGLSQFDAPAGSLLAFSTAPGSVAADGRGVNGLYTEHLVRELSVKGARIEDSFKRVRLAVRLASNGTQVPWESTSLEGDVYLFPAGDKLSEAQLEEQLQRELDTWNRIKNSKVPEDWESYLQQYPSGRFAEIAQTRLSYFLTRLSTPTPAVTQIAVADPPVPETSGAQSVAVNAQSVASSPAGAQPVPSSATVAQISAGPSLTPGQPPPPHALLESSATPAPATASIAPQGASPASSEASYGLAIGHGMPAPMLMRPSENPLSAGTYALNRRFSVGDVAVYTVSDRGFVANARIVTLRVTRVDEDNDRIEMNDGRRILDSMGNLLQAQSTVFEPRQQFLPAELQLGRKWTTRFRRRTPQDESEIFYDCNVAAREKVKVVAGEFDAFRLDGIGWSTYPYNPYAGSRLGIQTWVTPGFNFAIKIDFLNRPRWGGESGELWELVSCRQRRWTQV